MGSVPSNSYDLVVLGDDLAALVCATLCARRGMRTLVLGDDRPARYTLGPHKLPVEPALWPTRAGAAGERVLKELHAELALRRKLREPKIAAQLVAPDLRVDLGADRLAGELEREVGPRRRRPGSRAGSGPASSRACSIRCSASEHAFPGVGFFERREVAKLAERVASEAGAWWTEAQRDPHASLWRQLAAIALRHPVAAADRDRARRRRVARRAGRRCAATATRSASCSSRSSPPRAASCAPAGSPSSACRGARSRA